MPTYDKEKNEFINLVVPKELARKVEDYQFDNRVKNRSEAIRQLIQFGLKSHYVDVRAAQ